MGVLTDKHFSANTDTEKCSRNVSTEGAGEQEQKQSQQLQLTGSYPVVVQTPYPTTTEEIECLQELRRRINNNEYIRDSGVEQDDEFLLAFVRGKKCNCEKAFQILQSYVQIRKVKYTKFFKNLSPRNFRYLFEAKECFGGVLKRPDLQGRCVGIGISSRFDPRKEKAEDCLEAMVAVGLELLRTDNAPRNGLVLVFDASGFGLRHAREFTMSRIYMFLQIFLNSYPVRYKGFHILNNGYIFDTILTLLKQLIPKKLRERIHLHGSNYDSLYKHVPREILPESLGGLLSDEEAYHLDFNNRILDNCEYYEKMAAYPISLILSCVARVPTKVGDFPSQMENLSGYGEFPV